MPHLPAPNAYYGADVATFLSDPAEFILGRLTAKSLFAVDPGQRDAWIGEIEALKAVVRGITGTLFLEFDVPRIGSRIDAVLIW